MIDFITFFCDLSDHFSRSGKYNECIALYKFTTLIKISSKDKNIASGLRIYVKYAVSIKMCLIHMGSFLYRLWLYVVYVVRYIVQLMMSICTYMNVHTYACTFNIPTYIHMHIHMYNSNVDNVTLCNLDVDWRLKYALPLPSFFLL
jgi:hypothetical protein